MDEKKSDRMGLRWWEEEWKEKTAAGIPYYPRTFESR